MDRVTITESVLKIYSCIREHQAKQQNISNKLLFEVNILEHQIIFPDFVLLSFKTSHQPSLKGFV